MICSIQSLNPKSQSLTLQDSNKNQYKDVDFRLVLEKSTINNISTAVSDMVNLEVLNDAELLNNLQIRYQQDLIYTFVGPTLLAVNPFKKLPNQNQPSFILNYIKNIIEKPKSNYKDLVPHAFSVASEAYRQLTGTR